jgi:GT2 family glycosyltransferase
VRVVAVIVHYGPTEPTAAVARSLVPLVDELVVAVNDGSPPPDDLPAAAHWIAMARNLGYADAFRRAVHDRQADLFVLLNNDVEISPETFRTCVRTFEADPAIGVLGPVLRYPDGRLQSGAGRLTRWSRGPVARIEPGPGVTDCAWVTGAAMFLRGELMSTVGIDGSYFLGYEDTDFCVRAGRAGYRVVCHGGAPAVHYGSQVISGPRWSYYAPRNRVWFARACFGLRVGLLTWLGQMVRIPRIVVADMVKRRDLTSTRLSLLAAAHAWMRKPSAAHGPRADEPIAGRVMRW